MGLEFDGGTTEAINCGSDTSIDDLWAGGATAMGWLWLSAWTWASGEIIANKNSLTLGTTTCRDGWAFGASNYSSWAALYFTHSADSNQDRGWRSPIGSISLSTWYHCAVTWNKSSPDTAPILYLNASSQTVTQYASTGQPPNTDAAQVLRLGANYRSPLESIDGVLADLRLYSRALSAAEILSIYAARGTDSIVDAMVARYALNGPHASGPSGAGSVPNISPNAPLNDGTPAGTPLWAPDTAQRQRRSL